MRLLLYLILSAFSTVLFAQSELNEVEIVNGVNSNYDDYAPVLTDSNSLMFASSRPNALSEKNLIENHNIFRSSGIGGKWSEPVMTTYLSNSDNHETPAGISTDRSILYIYKTFSGGDIYYSSVSNGQLKPLHKASFNSQWHESSASSSSSLLFFTSDRPGGKGGHDIYCCTKEGNGWSEPVNMYDLNSEKEENYVSLSGSGDTLFFSSKGFDSKGGYDIYRSVRKTDGQWSQPVNIGEAVNTSENEIYSFYDPAGELYFSSDRPNDTLNGYNIYVCREKKIRIEVPLVLKGKSQLVEDKKGTVDLIKTYVEVEGLKRHIPDKIEVDITGVFDTSNVIFVSDLPVNKNIKIIDDKSEAVIKIKKETEKLENLTLEEVKKNIDFEINYCAVQVGAFAFKTSIMEFSKDFPLLSDKVVMITQKNYNRFVMRETFEDLDSAIALQKKCMIEYHSVPDTFVAVYDMNNKRVIIYFDYAKNTFKMLKPEEQFEDDVLRGH